MSEIIVKFKADDIVQLQRKLSLFNLQNDNIEIVSYTYNKKVYTFDKNKPTDFLKLAKEGQFKEII